LGTFAVGFALGDTTARDEHGDDRQVGLGGGHDAVGQGDVAERDDGVDRHAGDVDDDLVGDVARRGADFDAVDRRVDQTAVRLYFLGLALEAHRDRDGD